MPKGTVMPSHTPRPFLELRCGGLHLTIQRVPGWLLGLLTTAIGAVTTWWTTR
ncbi:hypothetical protein ACFU6R_24430 [Streptomyces sp. NPDC057499]|uniref:hypothetical protein n=1 Tax=Streptomyces sp. NPDC057499 TaxID=3346150 RepID=UPI00369BD78A